MTRINREMVPNFFGFWLFWLLTLDAEDLAMSALAIMSNQQVIVAASTIMRVLSGGPIPPCPRKVSEAL